VIDLRSDVLGPLGAETLSALLRAAADRPGFVRHEDEHQARLERELSEAFGFEAALFLPTGTMANQISIRLWCAPGEAVAADHESHLAVNEASATAGLNGVAVRPLPGERGHLSPALVRNALGHRASTSSSDRRLALLWLENTHNRAGGTIMPPDWLPQLVAVCKSHGGPAKPVAIHVDGARIWHASVAGGIDLAETVRGASSATVCLNKALAAPAGALLLGSRAFIDEASRVQKMFGGLWRPVGFLAAAASAAAAHHKARIAASHDTAHTLATHLVERLQGIASVPIPETNIVMVGLASEDHVERVLVGLVARGVRASGYGRARLRFVLHAGISHAEITAAAVQVAETVEEVLTELKGSAARKCD